MEENFQYHGIDLYGSYLNYRSLIVAIFIINLIGIIFLISIIYIDELEELKENYEEYYNLSLAMVFSGLVAIVLLLVGMFLIIKYKNDISMENNIINNILQITYAKSYRANLRNELATYLYNRIPESDKTSHEIGGVTANEGIFKSKLADWLSGGGGDYKIANQPVNRLGPVAQYGLVNTTGTPIPVVPNSQGATVVPNSQGATVVPSVQVPPPPPPLLPQIIQKSEDRNVLNILSKLDDEIDNIKQGDKTGANELQKNIITLCDSVMKRYPSSGFKIQCDLLIDRLKKKLTNNNQILTKERIINQQKPKYKEVYMNPLFEGPENSSFMVPGNNNENNVPKVSENNSQLLNNLAQILYEIKRKDLRDSVTSKQLFNEAVKLKKEYDIQCSNKYFNTDCNNARKEIETLKQNGQGIQNIENYNTQILQELVKINPNYKQYTKGEIDKEIMQLDNIKQACNNLPPNVTCKDLDKNKEIITEKLYRGFFDSILEDINKDKPWNPKDYYQRAELGIDVKQICDKIICNQDNVNKIYQKLNTSNQKLGLPLRN